MGRRFQNNRVAEYMGRMLQNNRVAEYMGRMFQNNVQAVVHTHRKSMNLP
jgi:hypothetical protein